MKKEKIIIGYFPVCGLDAIRDKLDNVLLPNRHWHKYIQGPINDKITKSIDNGKVYAKLFINPLYPENYKDIIEYLADTDTVVKGCENLEYILFNMEHDYGDLQRSLIRDGYKFISLICTEEKYDSEMPRLSKLNYDKWIEELESYGMPILKLDVDHHLIDILSDEEYYNVLNESLNSANNDELPFYIKFID